jgi:hypothetical protein
MVFSFQDTNAGPAGPFHRNGAAGKVSASRAMNSGLAVELAAGKSVDRTEFNGKDLFHGHDG